MSNGSIPSIFTEPILQTDDYLQGFDPDAYQKQNYSDRILPEDRGFIEFITQTSVLTKLGVKPKSFMRAIDVGNAGVFIGPGLLAPLVKDEGSMGLYDVGQPQLHNIIKTLKKSRRGNLGMWQKFEDAMAGNELWEGAIARACRLGQAEKKDIFDLEPNEADAGSMFYVAESITSDRGVCEKALNSFLNAIRPGGLVIWAGMTGSDGYDTAGRAFSATWIDPQDMIDLAEDKVANISMAYTDSSMGARGHAGPQYSGMALLVGIKR